MSPDPQSGPGGRLYRWDLAQAQCRRQRLVESRQPRCDRTDRRRHNGRPAYRPRKRLGSVCARGGAHIAKVGDWRRRRAGHDARARGGGAVSGVHIRVAKVVLGLLAASIAVRIAGALHQRLLLRHWRQSSLLHAVAAGHNHQLILMCQVRRDKRIESDLK